jgi:hypothetical protein
MFDCFVYIFVRMEMSLMRKLLALAKKIFSPEYFTNSTIRQVSVSNKLPLQIRSCLPYYRAPLRDVRCITYLSSMWHTCKGTPYYMRLAWFQTDLKLPYVGNTNLLIVSLGRKRGRLPILCCCLVFLRSLSIQCSSGPVLICDWYWYVFYNCQQDSFTLSIKHFLFFFCCGRASEG